MKKRESFGPGDLAIQNVSTSNLISGGASADYDTLKEIEDKMKQLEAGGVAVDKTLTVENMPADSKTVGDKIKNIEENGTASINEIKIVGKLQSINDLKIPGEIVTGKIYTADGKNQTAQQCAEIFNDHSNKAIGSYSHAEGTQTTARGTTSHAEGYQTTASGQYSHAEGGQTKATAKGSHAEGQNTTASGSCSHAEGSGTVAYSDNQHVQGKYNTEDTASKYAFIIGNGTSDVRSNAFAIDWNGLIYVNNASTGINVATLASTISTMSDTITSLEARIAALEGNNAG